MAIPNTAPVPNEPTLNVPRQTPADGIDPNVRVPRAVREAAARASAIHKESLGITEQPQTVETPPEAPVQPTNPTPPPSNIGEPPPQVDDWKHKYDSLKGRFDRAEEARQSLTVRINEMTQLIANMQAAPKSEPSTSSPPERLITDKEQADYGEEFFDVVARRAKEIYQPEITSLKNQITELQGQLKQTTSAVAISERQKMLNYLDESVAGWRDTNTDQNFLTWLALPEVYSGVIRRELLQNAFERNDGNRVASFFKGFLAEEAATVPPTNQPTNLTPESKVPRVDLEQFAAPGRAKTAATTTPAEKPYIKREQIRRFYADVAAGRFRGRDAEQRQIEAQIFEAQREDRIAD